MCILAGASVSGIKDVTIATTGTGALNWSYIPTAGKSQKSEAEFVSEIKEVAQKAALATNKTEAECISRQVLQLMAEEAILLKKGFHWQVAEYLPV